jgi:hypothetical protein
MKKLSALGTIISREEAKKIVGGYSCYCKCANGNSQLCPAACGSSACFNYVYSACGGNIGGATCYTSG